MAKFTVSDAASRAGVERTTIYRKVHKGEISAEIDAHGVKVIDAAELLRVYPQARVIDAPATGAHHLDAGEQQHAAGGRWRSGMSGSRR